MNFMISQTLIRDFADIIGKLTIAINLKSLRVAKNDYEKVLNELIKWVSYYYEHENLNIVTHDESLEIHNILLDRSVDLMMNASIPAMESILSDDILNRYEVIVKTINDQRSCK